MKHQLGLPNRVVLGKRLEIIRNERMQPLSRVCIPGSELCNLSNVGVHEIQTLVSAASPQLRPKATADLREGQFIPGVEWIGTRQQFGRARDRCKEIAFTKS